MRRPLPTLAVLAVLLLAGCATVSAERLQRAEPRVTLAAMAPIVWIDAPEVSGLMAGCTAAGVARHLPTPRFSAGTWDFLAPVGHTPYKQQPQLIEITLQETSPLDAVYPMLLERSLAWQLDQAYRALRTSQGVATPVVSRPGQLCGDTRLHRQLDDAVQDRAHALEIAHVRLEEIVARNEIQNVHDVRRQTLRLHIMSHDYDAAAALIDDIFADDDTGRIRDRELVLLRAELAVALGEPDPPHDASSPP